MFVSPMKCFKAAATNDCVMEGNYSKYIRVCVWVHICGSGRSIVIVDVEVVVELKHTNNCIYHLTGKLVQNNRCVPFIYFNLFLCVSVLFAKNYC